MTMRDVCSAVVMLLVSSMVSMGLYPRLYVGTVASVDQDARESPSAGW